MLRPDVNNNDNQTWPYEPVPGAYRPDQGGTGATPIPRNQYEDQTEASSAFYRPTQGEAEPRYSESVSSSPPPSYNYRSPLPPSRPPARGLRTGAIIGLIVLLAIIFGTGLFAGWQFGRQGVAPSGGAVATLEPGSGPKTPVPALNNSNITTVREQVVSNVRPAVVQINVTTQSGQALGSGVIIDKRGYIITNNHVVAGATRVDQVVLSDGTKINDATVVGTDPADDLAVVKITPPQNMTVIPIGDSSALRVGQDVLAIGNPLGNTQTVTNGIVSALNRTVSEGSGGATIPNAIQTDAPINPGNSGGALVDLQGNLIGVPTLTAIDPEFNAPANGVGFAIPSNRVKFIAQQIIQDGKVTHTGRAALGISAESVDTMVQAQDNLAVDHGVLIAAVTSGGAAANAGLQQGDVIVQIDNHAIDTVSSLEDALISKNPGETVTVHFYRGNQQQNVNVTLGELQAGS